MTHDEALALLLEFNHEPFHILHALTVQHVMEWYAEDLGYGEEKDFWGNVGLLHDLDFELYPEEHCKKEQEILTQRGIDPRLVHAVVSHGYGICVDVKPEHEMEKVLFASDELTGLIGAVIKMHPSGSTKDLKLSSLKKKFKQKSFAAGCSRDVITRGAEMLGWDLETLMQKTIAAMQASEDAVKEEFAEIEKNLPQA